MKSIYDSMSAEELRAQSALDLAFLRKGNSLANARRNSVHERLLKEEYQYQMPVPNPVRGGEPLMQTRTYNRYSSPPEKMLRDYGDAEMAHWFPELFELAKEQELKMTMQKIHDESPYGKRQQFVLHFDRYTLRFQYHFWPGCCAMAMISGLDGYGHFGKVDSIPAKAVAKRIIPMMRNLMGTHQVMFAYSTEEITSQDRIWKSWGGVDIQSPFDSFKTGNEIHTAAIDLANAHDIIDARERRDRNEEQASDYDEDEDGDF